MQGKEAAFAIWRAFATRDADAIRAVLTEDVEWRAPPRNATAIALGVTDHMIGPDAIIRFILEDFPRLFSAGMRVEPISVTAEGERVVFEQRQSATLANGRRYAIDYVFIFEMKGTRVHRIREYMDTQGGRDQVFGSAPAGQIV